MSEPRRKTEKTRRSTAVAKRGRPSSYAPEYADDAEKLCLLGATDADMADFFGVAESTINNWKEAHADFLESIKRGKAKADATIADSLYRRALGYEHNAVKIITVADGNNQGSHVEQVPYIERYPPDTAAAIFWLKNRRPDLWREKQEITLVSPDVQARLHRQVVVINSRASWTPAELLDALDAVWS